MKKIIIAVCTVMFTSVFAQEVKNYKLKTKADVFEINVLSSDVLIEGYSGNEILVKEVIEKSENKVVVSESKGKNKRKQKIVINSDNKKSERSEELDERRKGLKPIKEKDSSNNTTLKEESGKVVLTNVSGSDGNFQEMIFNDFSRSKFEIKVPNSMKIIVKKGKGVSPFMLGKDTQFKIKNFKGEIEMASLNQDIILENISNSTLINTMLGDIEASFDPMDKDAIISLISTAGFIDISIPSKENISFDLESMAGEVLTNLDLDTDSSENQVFKQKYKADYNGGGTTIELKTTAGDIYIRKK